MPAVIELRDVSKRFRLQTGPSRATTLKSAFIELVRRHRVGGAESFAALQNLDLSVERGHTLGVIGPNGSGKSTLLKLIAGIYRPDSGTVSVEGRIAPLIELGAGFHPELTGRENVIINGIVLGLSRREIVRRLDDIVRFAEVADFIDQPSRTYSSGMYMRLAFSVAVHLDPEIFLVDEVLAVGDEAFAKKCADRIAEFQRRGRTMVIVTHDPAAVERWCDEVIWLDHGVVRAAGPPRKVIDLYRQAVAEAESASIAQTYAAPTTASTDRWGTREIEIDHVRLLAESGAERYVYEGSERVVLSLRYRVHQAVPSVVFGFAVLRNDGLWVYGTNTQVEELELPALGTEGEVRVAFDSFELVAGSYFIDVAVHSRDGVPYDYHSRRYPFSIRSRHAEQGVARIAHRWDIAPGPPARGA